MPRAAPTQFSGIFISYRRGDSAGHAGRLFDRLSARFGKDQVFMDIDHIEPGDDFVQVIEDAVGSCEILLTVIGRRWLLSADHASRRLDDPNDFVRLEIVAALRRNIRVIPVLVEGATMPRQQDLPDELSHFTRRHAIELSDQRWGHDVSRLISTLEKVFDERKEARLRAERDEEERQRLAAAEERRRQEEEQSRRKAEERRRLEEEEESRRLEEEERRKSEEVAALAAQEQQRREEEERQRAKEEERQRAAEEERQREAQARRRAGELERKRREAEEAERERREAEKGSRARAAEAEPGVTPTAQEPDGQAVPEDLTPARPPAIDRRMLLAGVGCLVLAAAVAAMWWRGAGGGEEDSSNRGFRPEPTATASQPAGAGAAGPQTAASPAVQNAAARPAAPEGMVYVPGGEFTMGRDGGDIYERPAHGETVKAFFIDIYEMTCGDYEKFVRETGRPAPPGWEGGACPAGAARRPVTGVTWDDADAFCRARGGRLPTEAEWEFAARGADGRRYPWGNKWRAGLANADGASGGVVDVGSYPEGKSPFGVFDMAGNAWEWTSTDLLPYQKGQRKGRLPVKMPAGSKVIRGCMYACDKAKATTTYRRGWPASGDYDYSNTGFRCAKDPEQ